MPYTPAVYKATQPRTYRRTQYQPYIPAERKSTFQKAGSMYRTIQSEDIDTVKLQSFLQGARWVHNDHPLTSIVPWTVLNRIIRNNYEPYKQYGIKRYSSFAEEPPTKKIKIEKEITPVKEEPKDVITIND